MSHVILAVEFAGMFMTLVGLGGLIFFHELGHFLACRVTGTRVEAFAIGFGPKILGWRRGGTVYKLCLIPLGGYVKMAAENPGEARTDAPDEFPNKSYSQRLLIMSAGVIFNGILAFLLFVWAFHIGIPFARPEVGTVQSGGAAWEAGLQRGDVVRSVNGNRILAFADLATEVALSGEDEVLEVLIERDGIEQTVDVVPHYSESRGMPTIGVAPAWLAGAADVTEDSVIAKAGGRVGDQILAVGPFDVRDIREAEEVLFRLAGESPAEAKEIETTLRIRRADGTEETLDCRLPIQREQPQVGIVPFYGHRITKIRPGTAVATLFRTGDILVAINGAPMRDFHVFSASATGNVKIEKLTIRRGGEETTVEPNGPFTDRDLGRAIYCGDWDGKSARVSPRPGMPAERAGVQTGDTILSVGTRKIETWSDVQEAILEQGASPIAVKVQHEDGTAQTITIEPAGRATLANLGYVFQAQIYFAQEQNLGRVLALGWDRTVRSIRHVVLTLKNLLTARVSARHLGGPIAIAQITYGMFSHGWAKYLYVLALISMNLAILNLLPIPVLDGGQIVLLTAEKIRGEPLPEKFVGYLQLVGLVLILSLIALALTNDITNLLR